VGLFPGRAPAEQAIQELHQAGFGADQIGLVMRRPDEVRGPTAPGEAQATDEGAAISSGAAAGGLVGGLLAVALAFVPGLGPVLSAGTIAAALFGVTAGGLVGGLIGLGVTAEEAHEYERELQAGRALVIVQAGERSADALAVLHRCGARTKLGPA
jgi:outer membrane lipoprotein SlyB